MRSKLIRTAEPQKGSGTADSDTAKAKSEHVRTLRSPANFLHPERRLSNIDGFGCLVIPSPKEPVGSYPVSLE